jgi:hypothetical protein
MARLFRWLVTLVVIVAAVAGTLYARRTNPIQNIPGRQLTGEVVSEPVSDWSFAADVPTVAIETRPAAPYSVTTWSFVHEGHLYIPASRASQKTWTQFAAADPQVRVKIGEKIYPGLATRVLDESLREPLREVVRAKYKLPAQMPASMGSASEAWLFRIDSPQPSAATEPPDVAAGKP